MVPNGIRDVILDNVYKKISTKNNLIVLDFKFLSNILYLAILKTHLIIKVTVKEHFKTSQIEII